MYDDLSTGLSDLLIKYRGLQSAIETTKKSIDDVNKQISSLEYERDTLRDCRPIIDDIISKFSDSLLHKLEDLVTLGLRTIFYDRNYSLQIRVVNKRNSKCVDLLLNDNGNLIPVRNSCVAGGILVVIASVIQIFYIMNLDVSKYIFLDEQMSQLSKQYVPYFMDFIKTLCNEAGLTFVLITHDSKFMEYGDRIYIVDHGKFTLKEQSDIGIDVT